MNEPLAPAIPSPDTFGPPLQNFGAIEDPTTQLDASAFNRMRAQLAAISQTAPMCMVAIAYSVEVLILRHSAVWGNGSGVMPSVSRLGAGRFQFQWAVSYFDLRDDGTSESHAVNILGVQATAGTTSAKLFACYELTDSRTIVVDIFTDAGAATDPNFITVVCW